ncbi:hypothetical protein F383_31498 [Gossypium arboreum]|uniref:Uncharacterized protein n=1 Tax=Gossypium arboreum TaxID=29729 RepID=A0A0B0MUG4_GOSAR|nr:hypothetical protein F383_31498 [Gossypium arboreum]
MSEKARTNPRNRSDMFLSCKTTSGTLALTYDLHVRHVWYFGIVFDFV